MYKVKIFIPKNETIFQGCQVLNQGSFCSVEGILVAKIAHLLLSNLCWYVNTTDTFKILKCKTLISWLTVVFKLCE